MKQELRIEPLGDQAIVIQFGNTIRPELSLKVYALYHTLCRNPHPGWLDIIPAYASITIVFDARRSYNQVDSPYKMHHGIIRHAIAHTQDIQQTEHRKITIPVCYDSDYAPDLKGLCQKLKVGEEEFIQLHTSSSYTVYMIGFLPGFAYMGSVNPRIESPRLDKPRTHVAAGSVGIAGFQTGIYPLDSPGGWNIIGRTPLAMFDLAKEEPVLLRPGDEVNFYAIDKFVFDDMIKQQPTALHA